MDKKTEVEVIGPLSKNKFEELKEIFSQKATFLGVNHKLTLMYFRDKIPKDIEEIKNEKVDLRLRIINKHPETVLKYGLFTGSHSREEISIKFDKQDFHKYIKFLCYLGWDKCVLYATKNYIYKYKGVEFSLVYINDYGYNFEAEIVTSKENEKEARKKIFAILKELEIAPFINEKMRKQCNDINNRKEFQFDFLKQDVSFHVLHVVF